MLQRKAEREREKGAILPNCYGKIILSEKAGQGRSDDGGGDDDGVWTAVLCERSMRALLWMVGGVTGEGGGLTQEHTHKQGPIWFKWG